jgi:hypothetical protein
VSTAPPRRRGFPAVPDPAEQANARILADRQARIDAEKRDKALADDIGLNLKTPESAADNAAEFLADEWDKKAFGDAFPTYTRVIYGPDPLLSSCPDMKERIESIGLEEYANATAEAILLKEERAIPDVVLRKGLRAAILRFGKESVANAFRDRILRIPSRTVEVEADRNDDYIYAKPMEEAVARYGSPGMAPKFLSERCIDVLGLRGYRIVKDSNGDPVKVGKLIMGEIPLRMAENRRRHFAEESEAAVRESAEAFEDRASRAISDAGGAGLSVLQQGERITSNAAGDLPDPELTRSYMNRSRETGFTVERQR